MAERAEEAGVALESAVVVIVGLPGVGKSTIGRRAAKRLGWKFIDLDSAIESSSGQSVRDIFATSGEEGFRDIESKVLEKCLESSTSCIVAAGGGIVLRERNREMLREARAVIWMVAEVDDLEGRLKPRSGQSRNHRPLLDGNVTETLRRLRDERGSLYAQVATRAIETSDKSFDAVLDEVVSAVSEIVSKETPNRSGPGRE